MELHGGEALGISQRRAPAEDRPALGARPNSEKNNQTLRAVSGGLGKGILHAVVRIMAEGWIGNVSSKTTRFCCAPPCLASRKLHSVGSTKVPAWDSTKAMSCDV